MSKTLHGDKLRVAIDATVAPATAGGVAQVMLGLVHALGKLNGEQEEYLLIVQSAAEAEYLKPFLGPNQRFVSKSPRMLTHRAARRLLRAARRVYAKGRRTSYRPSYAVSDGFYESLESDVIHFPHQRFVVCGLPSVYNPHDLQHLYFPQFFNAKQLIERDTFLRAGCHFANTVAVSSQWVRDDLIRSYRLAPDKVQVIPWGPPTQAYAEPSPQDYKRVREKYRLEQPYALYPAMTWGHKNHVRLLEALARLREDFGLRLQLLCTGSRMPEYWSVIERRVAELELASQVHFTGLVAEDDLRSIYGLAQFLVVPTLFESDSSPIYEAWLEGLPVACSNVTSLPAQVLDAALLFDPYDVTAIAQALLAMATQDSLRKSLRARGYERVKDYNWERTAKAYRAVYRRAANRSLGKEDRWLLSWDWMQEPHRVMEAPS